MGTDSATPADPGTGLSDSTLYYMYTPVRLSLNRESDSPQDSQKCPLILGSELLPNLSRVEEGEVTKFMPKSSAKSRNPKP